MGVTVKTLGQILWQLWIVQPKTDTSSLTEAPIDEEMLVPYTGPTSHPLHTYELLTSHSLLEHYHQELNDPDTFPRLIKEWKLDANWYTEEKPLEQ